MFQRAAARQRSTSSPGRKNLGLETTRRAKLLHANKRRSSRRRFAPPQDEVEVFCALTMSNSPLTSLLMVRSVAQRRVSNHEAAAASFETRLRRSSG